MGGFQKLGGSYNQDCAVLWSTLTLGSLVRETMLLPMSLAVPFAAGLP